ncbi:MAG: haloacid dehalogenase [Pseudonocardiales bacterium]|nr:haloacid dehalogenase [Pseudonocardiales bacterium]
MAVRALLFDVFGTLVDWRGSLIDHAGTVAGDASADWPGVIDDWRRAYKPATDAVVRERAAGGPWRDLDELQRISLDAVLAARSTDLSDADRAALVQGWRRLRPWPDTAAGLLALRELAITATLSNGHVGLVADLMRFGDLRIDVVLSAQLADSYKPDPAVYLRALELLECEPADAMLVACHAYDLEAADRLGLRTAFVRRPAEWGPGGGDEAPDMIRGLIVVDSLPELADRLR